VKHFSQTLGNVGKGCQGQTLLLITNVRKLWTLKFYIWPMGGFVELLSQA
jgi:hypothetical protein